MTSDGAWRPAPCPLPTRWSGGVGPERVHPEHPRPQLVRPDWTSLNGLWDYAIRPSGEAQPAGSDGRILVPFPVESSLSGVARRLSADERLWYRRSLQVPAASAGRTWVLRFGAVDWRTEVWLDGRPLGLHEGGYDPFAFELGALGGEHELRVAVWDPTEDGPQPRGKQSLRRRSVLAFVLYTPASGIWQTVWLEQVPETRIEGLRLLPTGDTLLVSLRLAGARGGERLRAVARAGDREVGGAEGDAAEPLALALRGARRWSPEDPFLHRLELSLRRGGESLDRAESYFGLRDVSLVRDRGGALRIALDGEPRFLSGLLDQGYWPDGIYTAPTDEALRFDLEETRRLGFNLVRKHVKVEPARWYWHCDRLGLLVFQDMPSGDRMTTGIPLAPLGFDPTRWLGRRGIRRSPASARIFERELDALLEGLQPFPSIVAWVPFNEGWGQFDAARIARHVRERDPTRLVDAASGWVDSGGGELRDVHVYPGPALPSRRDPARADVLGEWGGLGLEVAGHRWPRRPFAYQRLASAEALADRLGSLGGVLDRLVDRGLAAAVYTQTTDVEGEVNGLLTYDRAVLKIDASRLAAWNRRLLRPRA
jgi:beta-galactosidase/beta-glucuronidase